MANEQDVLELVVEWEEQRRNGRCVSPAELCEDCPDLLPELSGQIEALKSTDWMFAHATLHDADETEPQPTEERHGRLDDYEIIGPVGRGGMATVYRARHVRLGREMAVKVLPDVRAWDARAVARFEREMRAVGGLSHPNIVSALHAGESHGTWFLAMELIDGVDVARLASRDKPIPTAAACEIVQQAAVGLQHAHENGLVHRDVKPSNLMLETTGTVKLLDLGLAREVGPDVQDETLTSTGNAIGTLDYMSPEQFNDSAGVDHRTDIYGLGATLFALLCGRSPVAVTGAESRLDRMRALANGQKASLHKLRPDLPADLVAFVERMLDSDLRQRPADAQEVADGLRPFTDGCDLRGLLQEAGEAEIARTDPVPLSGATEPRGSALRNLSRGSLWRWAAVGGTVAVLLIASSVVYFRTGSGTLIVKADDDVHLKQLEDAGVLLTDVKTGDSYRLSIGESSRKPGRYRIHVQQNPSGLKFSAEEFSITRGGTKVVEVTIEPPNATHPEPPTDEFVPELVRIEPADAAASTFGPLPFGRIIHQLQFTADGTGLLVAAPKDHLALLDAQTGEVIRRFAGHEIGSNAMVVTADGATLYSGDATGRILEHDFTSGKQRREVVPSSNIAIKQIALSADQKSLVFVRWWKDLQILNLATGESRVRSLLIHFCGMDGDSVFGLTQDLHLVRHSPTVKKLIGMTPRFDGIRGSYWVDGPRKAGVFVRDDGNVHVFDLTTGEDKHQFSTKKARMPIVRFSPDLTRLVVCHVGRQARVLDIASGRTLVTVTVGPTRRVSAVCFSPDGNSFAVGDVAGAVSVFRLNNHRRSEQPGSPSSGE